MRGWTVKHTRCWRAHCSRRNCGELACEQTIGYPVGNSQTRSSQGHQLLVTTCETTKTRVPGIVPHRYNESISPMSHYKTGKLGLYNPRYLDVAHDLFDRVRRELPDSQVRAHKGSFSVFGSTSRGTAAKIVIFDPTVGKPSRDWPRMRDGVYVWVRVNGPLGSAIWGDVLPSELPWMFNRMWREDLVSVAPRYDEVFAYFPVMAGDDPDEIKTLLLGCSRS